MAETSRVAEPPVITGVYSCGLSALAALLPDGSSSPEANFLRAHAVAMGRNGSLQEAVNRIVQHPDPADVPLLKLASELSLHRIELLTVALAAAVEMDLMCGRAVAHLQAPLGGSRPTLGLVAAAFAEFESEKRVIECLLSGAAVHSSLLYLLNENAPLAERAVAVPVPLCLALSGRDASWPGASLGLDGVPEAPLPPSVAVEAKRQAQALAAGPQSVLVLRSGSAAEGKAVAREIASALGRRALFIETEPSGSHSKPAHAIAGLGPLLLLRKLIPVFCYQLGPGERKTLPSLPHYHEAALALCGLEGSIEFRGETAASWKMEIPSEKERLGLWQAAIGDNRLAAQLASGYRHGSGRIASLGRLAHRKCLLDGRTEPSFADVSAASWVIEGSGLEALAQPLPDSITDEALVMTPALRDELHRLLVRCLTRERLVDGLGASALARYRPGVRALFTGPTGTGKTLAAGWLATQLGLPLYRADLASITSKYIGETEKNLAQLLAHAEESGIILLFDEADSIFGKRTEVKESNDRFANAQTNYLLQRIETFDGIALLTSNSRARFDPAFYRRLDMIIEFPLPSPEERRSLWLSHLGTNHRLSHRQLNQLAAAADLAGGHIRNAVLSAAVLAQSQNRPIEYEDVYIGLTDEYRKISRQMPLELANDSY